MLRRAHMHMRQPRAYQLRIINEVEADSSIVLLPTGAGKTLIASEVIKRLAGSALFLVPTCLLVKQQAAAVREQTGLSTAEFMGGMAVPAVFEVLVCTPVAFFMAQASGIPHLQWHRFNLVVFDEVHHVLKQHPYRKVARSLQEFRNRTSASGSSVGSIGAGTASGGRGGGGAPRVLGLSASLTYAVGAARVRASINQLCSELGVVKLAAADSEELRRDGYHGSSSEANVQSQDEVEALLPSGVVPEAERKPHLLANTMFARIRERKATRFSLALYDCVMAMERAVADADASFTSPLKQSMTTWGTYAHKRRARSALYTSLESWYEALRLQLSSWEEAEDLSATLLRMSGEQAASVRDRGAAQEPPATTGRACTAAQRKTASCQWPAPVLAAQAAFWSVVPATFPRLDDLKGLLLRRHAGSPDNPVNGGASSPEFRGVLFVQQRITTHVLDHFVRSDPDLSPLFRPAVIYSSAAAATASLSVSAGQVAARLADFASGAANLLITTVVAEEGMDVPAANAVFRFDPMHHAVSLVQGRGRARAAGSSFDVLRERRDRPVATLAQMEQEQDNIARSFTPQPVDVAALQAAQRSRERTARARLVSGATVTEANALAMLNAFQQTAKVDVAESWAKEGGQWRCAMRYASCVQEVAAHAVAAEKKGAKRKAALELVRQLQAQA
eukprot:jgi/Mesvir1/8790/Mv02698-RA.1